MDRFLNYKRLDTHIDYFFFYLFLKIMVSIGQLILNFFNTFFVLLLTYNLWKDSSKNTICDFLAFSNRKNIISVSIFFYIFQFIISKFLSIWNGVILEYFPYLSVSKFFFKIFVFLAGETFIVQGLKNSIIECFIIVLFCKRQFSLQSCFLFGGFMLYRAFHEPWVEKFRIIKRTLEDRSETGHLFFLSFICGLVHFETLVSKKLLLSHRFRTVNIIVGSELIFMASSVRGFLIDQLFLLANEYFFKGTWLSEDMCALNLRLIIFFTGGLTYKHALDSLNISKKGMFKYYILRRVFQCTKSYIESMEESTRFRKTIVSVGFLLRNPTSQEIDKLEIQACVICRGDMVPQYSKILSCGHIYHIRCLQNWVRRQYCCPTCLIPISSDSLYSVKKKSRFLRQCFEKKNVNIIAGVTGLANDIKIHSRENHSEKSLKSLPPLTPNITSIFFKRFWLEFSPTETTRGINKIDFYLKLLEKVEKTRKSILKNFFIKKKNTKNFHQLEKKQEMGWDLVKISLVNSRIQGVITEIDNGVQQI